MAQGKMKVKTKLPENAKSKKGGKKGNAVTKRANRPSKAKKGDVEDARRIKKIITKNVNKSIEEEIRAKISDDKKNLSRAQQAVVEHHKKQLPAGPS